MNALYLVFAAIPILSVVIAFFPELSGKGEAVPAGGFEYSVILPRRYLVLGGVGVGAFGILFLMMTDGTLPLYGIAAIILLTLTCALEITCVFCVIFFFGYRLTVRAGVIFYKIPCRRELVVAISDVDHYRAKKRKNGEISIILRASGRTLLAEGKGASLLLCELEKRNIKKSGRD